MLYFFPWIRRSAGVSFSFWRLPSGEFLHYTSQTHGKCMTLNNFLRNIFAIPLLSFALTICLCAQGSQPRGAGSTDERQIKQVLARYAESIDEADVRLASKVWLNSPAVSFIHPQGDEQGFAQIEHNFYQSL